MALFKIHRDLIKQDPGILPFLFSQFDGNQKDVTTINDAINQMEAYLVSGEGVPSGGQLEFTFSCDEHVVVPSSATILKDKYVCDAGEFLVWYECF